MCLSIPGKIIEKDGETAKVSIGGSEVEASLQLLDEAEIGDYVLVHSGFALEKISDEEAQETLRMIREMKDLADGETGRQGDREERLREGERDSSG